MKTLKTANYIKLSSDIDKVVKLINRGLNIDMAMEQVYGIGNINPRIKNQIQNMLKVPKGGKFPIRTI